MLYIIMKIIFYRSLSTAPLGASQTSDTSMPSAAGELLSTKTIEFWCDFEASDGGDALCGLQLESDAPDAEWMLTSGTDSPTPLYPQVDSTKLSRNTLTLIYKFLLGNRDLRTVC